VVQLRKFAGFGLGDLDYATRKQTTNHAISPGQQVSLSHRRFTIKSCKKNAKPNSNLDVAVRAWT
jgi:hypothetical protein